MFTTFVSLVLFALFTAPGFYATVRIRGKFPAYDTAPTPWEQVAWATFHSLRSHACVLVPFVLVLACLKYVLNVRLLDVPTSMETVRFQHVGIATAYGLLIFLIAEGFARRQMRTLEAGESSSVPLLHRVLGSGEPKFVQVYMRSGHVLNGVLAEIADNPKDFSSGIHDFVVRGVQIVGPDGSMVSEGQYTVVVNYRDVMFMEVVEEDDLSGEQEA